MSNHSPTSSETTALIAALQEGLDLPIVAGAASEDLLFIGHDREYRVTWNNGYTLAQAIASQWQRLLDPGLSLGDFASATIAQIKFPGLEEEPPFTIAAFNDEIESDCWGTHETEDWDDAQEIAGHYLMEGAFVVVSDRHNNAINPDLWL